MNIIGIDLGSSTTKIIETNEQEEILNRLTLERKPALEAIAIFIEKFNINIRDISKIVATGVGISEIKGNILNIPTIKIDEFLSIGEGGTYLSNLKEALVVSVGTGTAFVKCNNRRI